jgi:hypothetical protein
MQNTRGEIMTSVPSVCKNYNPDVAKPPTGIKCAKLGQLYECQNYVGEKDGEKNTCFPCKNRAAK